MKGLWERVTKRYRECPPPLMPGIQKEKTVKVVLLGSPNVGKSIIFHHLTGIYVTVSNYHGTTVAVNRGCCTVGGYKVELIDTPGMYSLLPITEEEKVTRRLLLAEKPEVVLHVIEAKNIDRMLNMTLQLIEGELPVILVVNLLDEAAHSGMELNLSCLQKKLGIPVIGTVATRRKGIERVRVSLQAFLKEGRIGGDS